jgi:probable HAF family extracellular repeat protein
MMLPNPNGAPYASYALSSNGNVLAVNSGGEYFLWTSTGGFTDLGAGDFLSASVGISGNGKTVIGSRAGQDGNVNPALWSQATGWVDLGHPSDGCVLDGSWGSGYDVNRDGTVAVGLAWYCPGAQGFQWTPQGGMVGLGHPTNASSRASAVSADGSTIVGFYEDPTQGFRRPVRWVSGTTDLFAGEQTPGEATAVNSTGSKIVGQAVDATGFSHAFYYSSQGGLVSLGTLSGRARDESIANAVANNGMTVGWSGDPFSTGIKAFVWKPNAGMVSLQKFLVRNGAIIPSNVTLTTALDISANGLTIVGTWQDTSFNQGGWIARLKPGAVSK